MKQHFLFSGTESPEEIKRILVDNAEGSEKMTVQTRLSEDEVNSYQAELSFNLIEVSKADEVLEAAKTAHKAAVKPLKLEVRNCLSTLRRQYKEEDQTVYRLPNFDTGMMEFVNLQGEIVSSRRLKPDEKQGRVFPLGKTAEM